MEGPSLHLLAEELAPFTGNTIIDAFGNAAFDKKILIGQTINDIYAFGKRLFLQCDDYVIITHFLMYGSYRIDTQRENMVPRLALITTTHSLYIYNCSVKCVQDKNIKKTLSFELDILSPQWNITTIHRLIKKHPHHTIDDILLDQDIFAGVGNIIKNEALFLSGVAPTTTISNLSSKKIKQIAQQTRLFSQQFLEWRKAFVLKKHLQIYRKKSCPTCNAHVIRKKTGVKQRWSFYCPHCQQ